MRLSHWVQPHPTLLRHSPASTICLSTPQALLYRYNVAWETTGASISRTLRQLHAVQALGYRTWVLYPIASVRTAQQRAVTRFARTRAGTNIARIMNVTGAAQRNIGRLWGTGLVDNLVLVDNTGNDTGLAVVAHLRGAAIAAGLPRSRTTAEGPAQCSCEALHRVTATLKVDGDGERQEDLLNFMAQACPRCGGS